MYARHFGLEAGPFSIAPDPRFLFMSERHREALAHLLYGVGGGGGFVLLSGEIGAGKTTVCRAFLEQVPPACRVAYVFNPQLTVPELLQTVLREFGIEAPAEAGSVKAHVDALNDFLLSLHAQGEQAVLVIDEAQNLSAGVLEQLRLLTNLETAERKLLQIVLIGQPELRQMLARPELEQLNQRVIARYHLGALSAEETAAYVRHRLAVAGGRGEGPFTAGALRQMHSLTGGVPRRINLLADRALLGAYAQGRGGVDAATVRRAAAEVFGRPAALAWWPHRAAPLLGVAALALLLGGGLAWALMQRPWAPPPTQLQAPATPAPAPAPAQAAVDASASAAPAVGPREPVSTDPAALLAAAHGDAGRAWRELALRWNVAIGEGDPCVAAQQAALACFRNSSGGLPLVQQLARPGIVTLREGRGPAVHAVLLALDADSATLQAGAQHVRLALPVLARLWRGDFATFWRTPDGWSGGTLATPQARDWLQQQLAAAGTPEGGGLRSQVLAFQIAQGLPADGVAGPRTLMRVNQLAGVAEPSLGTGS